MADRSQCGIDTALAGAGNDCISYTAALQCGSHQQVDRFTHKLAVTLQAVGNPRQIERGQQAQITPTLSSFGVGI